MAVMTFDSHIHFYRLRPQQEQPHLLVVPDAEDPYCPAPQGLVAPLHAVHDMVRHPCQIFKLGLGPWMRLISVLPTTWSLRALSTLQAHLLIVLESHLLSVVGNEDPYCPTPHGLVAPLHAVHGMVQHPCRVPTVRDTITPWMPRQSAARHLGAARPEHAGTPPARCAGVPPAPGA